MPSALRYSNTTPESTPPLSPDDSTDASTDHCGSPISDDDRYTDYNSTLPSGILAVKEPKKPATLEFHIKDNSHYRVSYIVMRGTKMGDILKEYKKRRGMKGTIRYFFDGMPVKEDQTFDDLGMIQGDVIDAFGECMGG